MTRIVLLIVLLHFDGIVHGQNIVQNGGAESITSCPTDNSQIYRAPPWRSSGNSPDLYHLCGSNGYSAPVNINGTQNPRNGEGYFGVATYSESFSDAREFAQNTLRYALVGGEQYYVEFHVSLSDSMLFAAHNIGVTFTDTDPLTYLECYPNCEIYYENDASNPLTSKTDWVKVNGICT